MLQRNHKNPFTATRFYRHPQSCNYHYGISFDSNYQNYSHN